MFLRLSPGGREQEEEGTTRNYCCNPSSRAARARAALQTAGSEMKNRLAANKPIQTVLVRQRLGGVGNGSPTAPRPSEIDEVAAEEAAKAAATAAAAAAAAAERETLVPAVPAEEHFSVAVEADVVPAAAAQETVPVVTAGGDVRVANDSSSSSSAVSGLSRRDM